MLVERYLFHLQEPGRSPLEIVAVTFTNKAAAELRSRIRRRIASELPDRLDLLAELEAAPIGTLHALAGQICREHPEAADVPPGFEIEEDRETTLSFADALPELLGSLPERLFAAIPYSQMRDLLKTLLADPWTSDRALAQVDNCLALTEELQTQARQNLFRHPDWRAALTVLETTSGKPGDKLEALRQTILAAARNLEAGDRLAVADFESIDRRVGSKKSWPPGGLEAVKAALDQLRSLVRKAQSFGAFQLEPSEADQHLAAQLPALREAYQLARRDLQQRQQRARKLSFTESELGALRALETEAAIAYYRERWKVFLVDEFQDTNPVQAELLEWLTAGATLTIVGDRQQAIYSFRRADVTVFDRYRQQIAAGGGEEVVLGDSFRARPALNQALNAIGMELLGSVRQPLRAQRSLLPEAELPVRAFVVQSQAPADQQRALEAEHLAQHLQAALVAGWLISDPDSQQLRPLEYRDIAILGRSWKSLDSHAEALANLKIPTVLSGGSLLETREAKDGWALLRAIAPGSDDLAIAAVLRSPFFTVSDRSLWAISTAAQPGQASWWERLTACDRNELARPTAILADLRAASASDRPSRLLQQVDRQTGYTAAIANLPGGDRRLADWQGFCALVRELEAGTGNLFTVLRQLRRLHQGKVELPRPPLAAANAVTLSTIHGAKGLEWPLVAVVNAAWQEPSDAPAAYSEPAWGVAFKVRQDGKASEPLLYRHLKQQAGDRQRAERQRLLYVALTRARDYLFVSANSKDQKYWEPLERGLTAAGVAIETVMEVGDRPAGTLRDRAAETSSEPPLPEMARPEPVLAEGLLGRVGSGLSELPVTALNTYARCPRRFQYAILDGHPGAASELQAGEGELSSGTLPEPDRSSGALRERTRPLRLGNLTHHLLAEAITSWEEAEVAAQAFGSQDCAAEAWQMVQAFYQEAHFTPFRQGVVQRERWLQLELAGLTLVGQADLVGEDWVLDYKTDRRANPQAYRWQLWVYAEALQVERAYLAYLRSPAQLHTLTPVDLAGLAPEVTALVRSLQRGPYPAQPTAVRCRSCPYLPLCADGRAAIA